MTTEKYYSAPIQRGLRFYPNQRKRVASGAGRISNSSRQREYWDGDPIELGDAWTLRKRTEGCALHPGDITPSVGSFGYHELFSALRCR